MNNCSSQECIGRNKAGKKLNFKKLFSGFSLPFPRGFHQLLSGFFSPSPGPKPGYSAFPVAAARLQSTFSGFSSSPLHSPFSLFCCRTTAGLVCNRSAIGDNAALQNCISAACLCRFYLTTYINNVITVVS